LKKLKRMAFDPVTGRVLPTSPMTPQAEKKAARHADAKEAVGTRTVRLMQAGTVFEIDTPVVESRYLGNYREPSTDLPGIVQTDDGLVYLIAPDGTRTLLGSGGGGSQTLSQVLMQGNDPDGAPIQGATVGTDYGAALSIAGAGAGAGGVARLLGGPGTAVGGTGGAASIEGGYSGDANRPGTVTAYGANSDGLGGGQVSVLGGDGDVGRSGGSPLMQGGRSNGVGSPDSGSGGYVVANGGQATGEGGHTYLSGGSGGAGKRGGDVSLSSGTGDGNNDSGAIITAYGGDGQGTTGAVDAQGGSSYNAGGGNGGEITLDGGVSGGGQAHLQGGAGASGASGGSVLLHGGAGDGGIHDGARIELLGGSPTADGLLVLTGVPTADPAVAGAVWSDAGTLKISAG
jgi:hypothetical protein